MTDKKLLKFAAQAAEYVIYSQQNGKLKCGDGSGKNFHWNPLKDDGDALRLVVDLGLVVSVNMLHTSVGGWSDLGDEIYVDHEDDKHAATRQAIVLAAAEIGKSLP